MLWVSDIMTRDLTCVAPGETVRRAAQLMADMRIASIPVCDGDRLVGVITDRDIEERAQADGVAQENLRIGDLMATSTPWCDENQPVEEAVQLMRAERIRRLPVVRKGSRRLVGVLTMEDVAARPDLPGKAIETLDDIAQPSGPGRTSPANE